MYTEMRRPKMLPRTKLDEYLAKGWFRMGQMIFTCHFLFFEDKLYSAVWLRLNLDEYKFKKRQRKIFRRNQEQFKTIIQKANFSQEKEDLYQRYKVRLGGYVPATLKESLLDNSPRNIYDTYECCVYDGDRLIAVSYFDVGSNSIASIKGIYDLDYSKYSLGFYTMLVEMKTGMDNDKQYYYPGYFVPGYEKFDYKLRIGPVDYYDFRTQKWEDFENLNPKELPCEKLKNKLDALQNLLIKARIHNILLSYPLYDKRYIGLGNRKSFQHPLLILCENNDQSFIIEYNLLSNTYNICKAMQNKELLLSPNWVLDESQIVFTCLEPLMRNELLYVTQDPLEIVLAVLKFS